MPWLYFFMSTHKLADAKNRLSQLIDRALEGEEIVITRHGKPVVELKALPRPTGRMTAADLDWLAEQRAKLSRKRHTIDAGTLVSRMRDEDWR